MRFSRHFQFFIGVILVTGVVTLVGTGRMPGSSNGTCDLVEKVAAQATTPDPIIVSFTADNHAPKRGEKTTLRWETTGTSRVMIAGADENLPSSGFKEVTMDVSKIFVLYAVKDNCYRRQVLLVDALDDPNLPSNERRSKAAALWAQSGAAQQWIGVAYRMGGETFLVARDEAREIMGVPTGVTRVPGARSWIRGLANVRGQLLPIIDLKRYLGSGETQDGRNTRVIVVNHREVPAVLVVDEVLGFRRFSEQDFHREPPPTLIRCENYLAGSFRRGSEGWPVFSLRKLVESPAFLQGSS